MNSKPICNFDGTMFNLFKSRMMELFTALNLEKFLTGEEREPPVETTDTENQKIHEYNQRLYAALVILKNNCDVQRQQMVQDIKCPKTIMDIFQRAYASTKVKNVMRLQHEFNEFKIDFRKSFTENFNELMEIKRLLKDSNCDKSDADLNFVLVKSLPDDNFWKSYVVIWEQDDDLKFESLKESLLGIELSSKFEKWKKNYLQHEGKRAFDVAAMINENERKKQKYPCSSCGSYNHRRKFCKKKNDLRCKHCNRLGHHPDKCWFKNNNNKRVTDVNAACMMSADFLDISCNKWIVDSACTRNMTGNIAKLHNIQYLSDDDCLNITLANGSIFKSTVKGDFIIDGYQIQDVFYVPELQFNLLSVPALVKKGYKVRFDEFSCVIQNSKHMIQGQFLNNLFVISVKGKKK